MAFNSLAVRIMISCSVLLQSNRKVIIQIFNGCRIFGYAKFGLEQIVLDSFDKEVDTLLYLGNNGIHGIQKVLWSGKIGQLGGFIQSTNRKGGEQTIYTLEKEHWDERKEWIY